MPTQPNASRRAFLKSTLVLPIALAAPTALFAETPPAPATTPDAPAAPTNDVLPKRQLGKNGPEVTMLSLGGMMSALSPDYIDIAWSMGIRYFDTADCYMGGKSEKIVGQWLAKYPERRKEIFLVSKDHPHPSPGVTGPEHMLQMIDTRLANLGTTYLDAFYIHGIGPHEYGEDSLNWPKSDVFKKVAEQLKSSGKVKMVGFSCHDGRLPDYLNAAAEGGFVDIIMLAYNPFYPKGGPVDTALDACHKAGIGLVAMKTMRQMKDAPKRIPDFDKLGLTVPQAVLHSAWSDPRISAVCNMIENADQMATSADAARKYKAPLTMTQMESLRETIMAGNRSMCTGCPSCEENARRVDFAFQDISRYVTYYEQDGNTEARNYYQCLSQDRRNSTNVDLRALQESCHFKTNYPAIISRAERYFS